MYQHRMNSHLRQQYCSFPPFSQLDQRIQNPGEMYFGSIHSPVDDFQYAPFQENGLTTELQKHAAVNIAPKGTKRKRDDEIVFNPALRGINRKKTVASPLEFETLRVVSNSNNGSRINFLTDFHLQKKKKKKIQHEVSIVLSALQSGILLKGNLSRKIPAPLSQPPVL